MLQYNVRDILADPRIVITVEETLDLPSITFGKEEIPIVQPPAVQGKIRNVEGNVLEFRGVVHLTVKMPCSRCMTDVEVPLTPEFSQRFIPAEGLGTAEPDEEVEVFSEYRLDLSDFVVNEIRLGIPMKVLCREDCKGLCPKCGHNLNEGPCGCDLREEDPRWDALKSLLQNQDRHGMEQEV